MSKEEERKKDENPYFIFRCPGCGGYLYLKRGNKSKTCTRCGKRSSANIIEKRKTEIVKGMTAAVGVVKKRQNALAIEELGAAPDLKSKGEYRAIAEFEPALQIGNPKGNGEPEAHAIHALLKEEILKHFHGFKEVPRYSLLLLCEELQIPKRAAEKSIDRLISERFLFPSRKDYYQLLNYHALKGGDS